MGFYQTTKIIYLSFVISLIFVISVILLLLFVNNQIHFYKNELALNILFGDVILDEQVKEYNLEEFHQWLNSNYEYSDYKDCKYWTYIWSNYLKHNEINYYYVTTKTHIFNVFELEGVYCLADQKSLNCYSLGG